MEIINIEARTFRAMIDRFDLFLQRVETLCKKYDDTKLKNWLDNQEVCEMLGISKRTLQSYREKGILPFSRFDKSNKLLYKLEDVEKLLQASHHPNTLAP